MADRYSTKEINTMTESILQGIREKPDNVYYGGNGVGWRVYHDAQGDQEACAYRELLNEVHQEIEDKKAEYDADHNARMERRAETITYLESLGPDQTHVNGVSVQLLLNNI